ncbi:hypothetical protein SKAU_G00173760 [Synaphobranchus kaupii]|uniref:Uncharacterized protein n=1 Tax=Synaphobranchus kaupii TaxID=118154 RepID=A0A9Q1FL29_SYNKA|nr:hypothetical protein SKAU_G00173760 [Synaphobranchus kaupii]
MAGRGRLSVRNGCGSPGSRGLRTTEGHEGPLAFVSENPAQPSLEVKAPVPLTKQTPVPSGCVASLCG